MNCWQLRCRALRRSPGDATHPLARANIYMTMRVLNARSPIVADMQITGFNKLRLQRKG